MRVAIKYKCCYLSPTGAAFGDKNRSTSTPEIDHLVAHIAQMLMLTVSPDTNSYVQCETVRDPTPWGEGGASTHVPLSYTADIHLSSHLYTSDATDVRLGLNLRVVLINSNICQNQIQCNKLKKRRGLLTWVLRNARSD